MDNDVFGQRSLWFSRLWNQTAPAVYAALLDIYGKVRQRVLDQLDPAISEKARRVEGAELIADAWQASMQAVSTWSDGVVSKRLLALSSACPGLKDDYESVMSVAISKLMEEQGITVEIDIELPTLEAFVHQYFMDVAEAVEEQPELFYPKAAKSAQTRSQVRRLIGNALSQTISKLLPYTEVNHAVRRAQKVAAALADVAREEDEVLPLPDVQEAEAVAAPRPKGQPQPQPQQPQDDELRALADDDGGEQEQEPAAEEEQDGGYGDQYGEGEQEAEEGAEAAAADENDAGQDDGSGQDEEEDDETGPAGDVGPDDSASQANAPTRIAAVAPPPRVLAPSAAAAAAAGHPRRRPGAVRADLRLLARPQISRLARSKIIRGAVVAPSEIGGGGAEPYVPAPPTTIKGRPRPGGLARAYKSPPAIKQQQQQALPPKSGTKIVRVPPTGASSSKGAAAAAAV